MADKKSLLIYLALFVLITISSVSATEYSDKTVTSSDVTPIIEEINDVNGASVIEETSNDIESSQKKVKTIDNNKETCEHSDKNGLESTVDSNVSSNERVSSEKTGIDGAKGVSTNMNQKTDLFKTSNVVDGSEISSFENLATETKKIYSDYNKLSNEDIYKNLGIKSSQFSVSISSVLITEGESVTLKLNGPKATTNVSFIYLVIDTNDTWYRFDGEFTKVISNLSPGFHYIRIFVDVDYTNMYFKPYFVLVEPKSNESQNQKAKADTKVKLTLKKVKVKKSAKKLVLTATLKKGKSAVKKALVTFKFNGKKYKTKTNNKGIAKVTIKKKILKKLKVGKKIKYQVSYGKTTRKQTVKVLK